MILHLVDMILLYFNNSAFVNNHKSFNNISYRIVRSSVALVQNAIQLYEN